MNNSTIIFLTWGLSAFAAASQTQEATITIHADQVLHPVSHYLTGACIEDVNHEIYGGIDSQMIFGESFAEAVPQVLLKGLNAYGGRWTPDTEGSLRTAGGDGPKLICDGPGVGDGEASVEMLFSRNGGGNAGLIVKVSAAANGADKFNGYEVALDPSGMLVLGRHRQNWEPIRQVPCEVPLNKWVKLRVRMSGNAIEVFVNGKSITQYEDTEHPLSSGAVGLRTWQMDTRFRNLAVAAGDKHWDVPFTIAEQGGWGEGVSGMWGAIRRGTADGQFSVNEKAGFGGGQCQRITFASGTGEIGIENESLNRWGMNFVKGKSYEGYLWARAESPTEIFVALESRDGSGVYVEKSLKLKTGDWQLLDFNLKPNAEDKAGRFAVKLKEPGSVTLGYAFLQPGAWGRFNDLPVRKDVAEGLINQGVTILRYGGSMINNPGYRWKNMIGPRAERPPYAGHWHPHSSNGWGIFEFLNFCESASVLGIPDVDINESPKDMADLMDYLNDSPDSEWGKQRVDDGHSAPYRLKYIELGNEERINDRYFEKFKAVAEVIWAKDPSIILIVGDFAYHKVITDPFNFTGADSGITTMAGQQKILQLAKQHDREVWFDVHVGTDGPRPDNSLQAMFSYIDAMDKIAAGAKHKVLVFELNADNHSQRRALANALAINAVQRDGRLPIVCSANGLQPDGQNDNDWNQGLLFLNPSQVWLQPPGYVTKMYSANYQPVEVQSSVRDWNNDLDASAQLSQDGKELVLEVVNLAEKAVSASILIHGYSPAHPVANVEELSGSLDESNTATLPKQIQPIQQPWQPIFNNDETKYDFQAHSITVLKFK